MAHLPKGQGVFLPPFKAWLASNIPAVYDNTMTYYEELCALIKYLQDVVIPALNHNAEAVTTIATAVEQLQKYVEDYFKNLDVQEEINNKLDQMVKDGTLQEIIGAYLNATAVWGFDTVAEMQAASNLIDGSYARTLGFYVRNDGGSALYKIRNKGESEVADNIFTFGIGNNLIAEYVYEGVYSTKQLGVKADGSEDVSSRLQSIINKIDSDNLANTDSNTPLTFDSGVYKVDSQIELSVNVPLKSNGLVTIKSYVDYDSCLWIKPKADDPANWFKYSGEFISGDGFIIEYAGETLGYGLEIGNTTNLGNYKGFMHSKISKVTIKNCEIGIQINPIHIYCDTFEKIQFEQCNKQVQWGRSGLTLVDSGERIVFTQCQFGGNHAIVFNILSAVGSMFINNSSIDYCDCVFNDAGNAGYTNVYIDNCHIEGITSGMTEEDKQTKPYGIIYGNFNYSEFAFTNGQLGIRPRAYLFTYLNDSANIDNKYRVIIQNMMIGTPENSNTPSNLYIAQPNVSIEVTGITGNPILVPIRISPLENCVPYGLFEGASVGSIASTTNSVISGSTLTYTRSIESTAEIYENSATGGHGIRFTATNTNPAVQIRSPKFDVKAGEKLYVMPASTNFSSVQVNIEYYDVTDTLISTWTKTPTYTSTPSASVTATPEYMVATTVPKNAVKCSIRLTPSISGRTISVGDKLSIDGIYCFKG